MEMKTIAVAAGVVETQGAFEIPTTCVTQEGAVVL